MFSHMARNMLTRITGCQAGFSLQEVMVVVALGMIITAVGLPVMSNAIANMKLRSSMTSVSGLLQNTRAIAVQQNKTKTACNYRATAQNSLIYFVKDGTVCTNLTPATGDPQVELEAPITPYGAPTGTGAPSSSIPDSTGYLTTDPSFNSRGIPCTYVSAGNCTTNGFVQYFKDNRIAGSGGWAGIAISPAGRIKRWFWNGSTWTD